MLGLREINHAATRARNWVYRFSTDRMRSGATSADLPADQLRNQLHPSSCPVLDGKPSGVK